MPNPFALEALQWIGKVRALIVKVRARVARRVIKVKKIMTKVARLEDHSETAFFPTMREASAAALLADEAGFRAALAKLQMADVLYWTEFHEITWEDGIKKPLIKLAGLLGDEDLQRLLAELDGGAEDDDTPTSDSPLPDDAP